MPAGSQKCQETVIILRNSHQPPMPLFEKDPTATSVTPGTIQLLVFALRHEEYALGLTEIQEIVPTPEITPVPNMPPAVKGVTNLRGRVVTVIDLETHFALAGETTLKPYMIVTERGNELFGLLVEAARQVLRIRSDELKTTPDLLGAHAQADALKGVVVHEEQAIEHGKKIQTQASTRLILALDLPKVLSHFSKNP